MKKGNFRPPTMRELQTAFEVEAIRAIAEENQLGASNFRLTCLLVRAKQIKAEGYRKTDEEMNN